MRFLTSLVAVVSTAMAVSAFDLKPHGSQTEIIPGSYIIQLKEGAALGRRDGVSFHFSLPSRARRPWPHATPPFPSCPSPGSVHPCLHHLSLSTDSVLLHASNDLTRMFTLTLSRT